MRRGILIVLFSVPLVMVGATGAFSAKHSAARAQVSARPWCADAIGWKKARSRLGRIVKVKARVVSSYYAQSSNGQPTFIDLGRKYPNSGRLTLLIWGRNRTNFPAAPERMFKARKTLCARGRVTLYSGVSEIQLGHWNAGGRMIVP